MRGRTAEAIVLVLPYRDHSYVRLTSARTGETLIDIKMPDGAIIVLGRWLRRA